ncbi:MAG: deoxynucleoside kinase [Patescibacteria group bacterium]
MKPINKLRIGVVGPMGVGKTSLVNFLSRDWKIRVISENFNKSPFLEKYYKNPERFSFSSQTWFYENRIRQIMNFNKYKKAIVDNDLEGNKVFALAQYKMGFMDKDEYSLYQRIIDLLDGNNNYAKTKIFLYTFASSKIVEQRIFERARDFELKRLKENKSNFSRYIKVLCEGFEEWYRKSSKTMNIFKVDSGDINYLKDKEVQTKLRKEIENFAEKRNIKII